MNINVHDSVLLQEVIRVLDVQKGDVFLDATLGGAGHALAVAGIIGSSGRVVGIDADQDAILRAKKILSKTAPKKDIVCGNFRDIDTIFAALNIEHIDKAIFDLGYSSNQLEFSGRGFSFQRNEPLLMTLAQTPGRDQLTAHDIVNSFSEEVIADILYGYGEERYARRIAKGIVLARKDRVITTTDELVDIIHDAVPAHYTRARIHFATRTFQALRIATNNELETLEEGLRKVFSYITPGGRIAVISFHSLEDRIVKRFTKEEAQAGRGTILTKKPILPSEEEVSRNPRARSAKLRALQHI